MTEIKLSSNNYPQNVAFIESILILLCTVNLLHFLTLYSSFREKIQLIFMFLKSVSIYFLHLVFVTLIVALALQNIFGENNFEFGNYPMAYQNSVNLLIAKSQLSLFVVNKVSWTIVLIVIAVLFRLFLIRSVVIGLLTEIYRNIKNTNYYQMATEEKWVLKDYISWILSPLINY